MSKKRQFNSTERSGVHTIGKTFTELFGWIFREQPVADFGVDAQVEITEDEVPTGRILAVQIKAGASYFREVGGNVAIYVDDSHMDYWASHSLPVIVVLHNPETEETLWQVASRQTATETERGWRIDISRSNRLDSQAREALTELATSQRNSARRRRFAADKDFMAEFLDRDAYVSMDVWVNKSWQIREVKIWLDNPHKSAPDFVIPVLVTWNFEVSDVMSNFFPWLEYEYAEDVEEVAGEIESHLLQVKLTEIAKAFLLVERYFEEMD